MKRLLSIFLIAFLLLCGCTHRSNPAETSITVPSVSEACTADGGAILCRKEIQAGKLALPNTEAGNRIQADLLQLCDGFQKTANVIQVLAQQNYTGQSDWEPYYATLTFTLTRQDDGVLSLYATEDCYSGDAHPSQTLYTRNYSTVTGLPLALSQYTNTETLLQQILDALKPQASMLYPDYEALLAKSFQPELAKWYLTEDTVCIVFSPYEIAPLSAGTVIAELPLSQE